MATLVPSEEHTKVGTACASQESVTEAALVQRDMRVCHSGSVNENARPTRQCFEKVSRR
jgi:hypothetical protein